MTDRSTYPTLAGERQRHVARSTGTLVVVYDGREQDMDADDEGGRWYTECVDHGEAVRHTTLGLARWHAPAPEEWCEACMAETRGSPRVRRDPRVRC
jgi:hypothetical protein